MRIRYANTRVESKIEVMRTVRTVVVKCNIYICENNKFNKFGLKYMSAFISYLFRNRYV